MAAARFGDGLTRMPFWFEKDERGEAEAEAGTAEGAVDVKDERGDGAAEKPFGEKPFGEPVGPTGGLVPTIGRGEADESDGRGEAAANDVTDFGDGLGD